MDQHLRVLLATVVGAGLVIGTAGVFIYNQLFEERRRLIHQQNEIRKLDQTVSSLREELDALRKLQSAKKKSSSHKRSTRTISNVDKESEYDMYSAVGTDDGSDEFFDLSDGDDEFEGIESVRLPNGSGDAPRGEQQHEDPVLAQLISTADLLLGGPAEDKRVAYLQLRENLEANPDCCALWWRATRACHGMGAIYALDDDVEMKRAVTEEGIRYGERAIAIDPKCSEAHKWYAILIGSRGEFQSIKEKIEDGFVFKQHVDIARGLRPDDASIYHLLGRFKYEVAMLSWIERKLATTLFAEPPTATLPEAFADCMQAEKLHKSPWKDNRLLLAKCRIAEGNYADAVAWLDMAAEIPVSTPDDASAEIEVKALLAKYGSYRANE